MAGKLEGQEPPNYHPAAEGSNRAGRRWWRHLKRPLKNAMQAGQILGEYAIGGAVAAFYYLEPGTTFGVDIFIAWEVEPSGLLNLAPIYAYLPGKGDVPKGETIGVEGWDVQFLPPSSPLVAEAIKQARASTLSGVPTSVFTRGHLMAICLETGRAKDVARLIEFVQAGKVDRNAFADILGRRGLQEKWTRFQTRFLNPWQRSCRSKMFLVRRPSVARSWRRCRSRRKFA